MEVAKILENKPTGKIYGLIGNIHLTTNNENYSIITDHRFRGNVKEYLNSSKDSSSLSMVSLPEEYLAKNSSQISISDLKKISLAKALIENKKYLILIYFEKEMSYKEKANYQRLFKKLATDYDKTILIYTNDLSYIWDITEEIIIIDNNNQINSVNKSDYSKILDNIEAPPISSFIKHLKQRGIKIEDYHNTNDLLKAIYRIKGD